jgi:pimeloyl-ACP methyl ester carboxylesterase
MLHCRTYETGKDRDWVVFVHGAGGSSAVWFKQIRDFRERFNVALPDLRGHGQSPSPDSKDPYTFTDVSRDVTHALDRLGVRRAHFVGISLGSLLIRQILDLDPERVHTMTLGGAITRLDPRARLLVGLGNLVKGFVPFLWLYRLLAWIVMPGARHREARNLFGREARKMQRDEFLRWTRLSREVDGVFRLFKNSTDSVPTLYLMGEDDYMFLPGVRDLTADRENSILEVLEGAGHVCNVEVPVEFNRHAISFIEKHSISDIASA